jgi:hypothetical protein
MKSGHCLRLSDGLSRPGPLFMKTGS